MGKNKRKKGNVTAKRVVAKRDARGRDKCSKTDSIVTRSRSQTRVSPQPSPLQPKKAKLVKTKALPINKDMMSQNKVRRVLIKDKSNQNSEGKNNNATIASLVQKGNQAICGDGIQVHIEGGIDSSSDENNDLDGVSMTDSDQEADVSVLNTVDDNSKDSEISFGGTATTEQLAKDPHIRRLLDSMLEEKLKEREALGKVTPIAKSNKATVNNQQAMVKSPSDTTIYTPAFANKINNAMGRPNGQNMEDEVNRFIENVRCQNELNIAGGDRHNVVSNDEQRQAEADQPGTSTTIQVTPELREARARADKVVLDAERFQSRNPATTRSVDTI